MTSSSIVLPFVYKISNTRQIETKEIDKIITDLKSLSHIDPSPGENNVYTKIYDDYKDLLNNSYVYESQTSNFEKYHLVSLTSRIHHQLRRIYKDCQITCGAVPVKLKSGISEPDYMQLFLRVLTKDYKNLIIIPENIIHTMNGFVSEAVFEAEDRKITEPISLIDNPLSPSQSNFSNMFVIFDCKSYSVDSPRKFHIPQQYTQIMITILAKYLNSSLTNEDVLDDISTSILEFITTFPSIDLLKKFKITQGKVYTTDYESFVIDESDLLFADFVSEFKKESTVNENGLSAVKYVDFESKKDYCQRIITSFLEQCYVNIMYQNLL